MLHEVQGPDASNMATLALYTGVLPPHLATAMSGTQMRKGHTCRTHCLGKVQVELPNDNGKLVAGAAAAVPLLVVCTK